MKLLWFSFVAVLVAFPVLASGDYWVQSERLARYTCPSEACGKVGELFFREKATIYEQKNGWARITQPYYASCVNNNSEFVDSGNRACVADNGIVDEQFAEWVQLEFLSNVRPADPAAGATGDYALISGSNDYQNHKDAFAKAARDLISDGRCTERDFKDMGGWLKSTTTYADKPIYFTYCGGMSKQNRLYLNAKTGEVFK